MSRTIRLSLALLFALMMVIATASGALAFNPPNNVENGVGANALCAPPTFPAFSKAGFMPGAGFVGPWNATDAATNPPPNSAGHSRIDAGPTAENPC